MEWDDRSKRLLGALAALLGAGGVIMQLSFWMRDANYRHDPFLWVGIGMLVMSGAIITTIILKRDKPTDKLLNLLMEEAEIYLSPQEHGSLAHFAKWMIDTVLHTTWQLNVYRGIEIRKLERIFDIKGSGITTTEYYDWTSNRPEGVIDFPLVQMGSSTVSLMEIDAYAAEIVENGEIGRKIYVSHNTDRFFQLNVRLGKRAINGESRKLKYRDNWKNAALPGWDIVMVPHACYFRKKIEEIFVRISSDRDLEMIFFYKINVDTGILTSLDYEENKAGSLHYCEVVINDVGKRDLIFVIYKRA
ncbi:MAG: hypothetical protein EOP60_03525 [Sphingomonadales bacterium]|nr:MAG: hypothetical protein EOP60_03525 [Sphingomonadales bacterium]